MDLRSVLFWLCLHSVFEVRVLGTPTCTLTGEPCVFPFTHNDISYEACIDEGDTVDWCPTSVNDDGSFESWEYCDYTTSTCSNDPTLTPTPALPDSSTASSETPTQTRALPDSSTSSTETPTPTPSPPDSTTVPTIAPSSKIEWIKVFSHNAAKAFFTVIFFFGEFI